MNRITVLALLILAVVAWPPPGRAQTSAEEMRDLRAEMQRLREEVAALRKELRESRMAPALLQASISRQDQPAAPTQEISPSAQIEMLRAQIEEQAQTKVESNSRFPVKIFGAIVANTFFNAGQRGEADWIDQPTVVGPSAAGLPRGSFSASMRQTRLGAMVRGPEIAGLRSSGVVAVDFFGSIPPFDAGPVISQPRLLYAFARLEGERNALQVGQDQMLFAPNNPTSLAAMSFPGFYRSGNLYARYPQIRFERRQAMGERNRWTIAGCLIAPLGGVTVNPGSFVYSNSTGERSMHPAFQGRLAWSQGGPSDAGFEIGASGHIGRLRFATTTQESWGFALDFDARAGRFGLGGEMFVGENLAAMGGAVAQFAKSAGGFIEARLRAAERLDFNGGYGTDRLFDLGSAFGTLRYPANASFFGNFIFHATPEFETSLEYRWLSTEPVSRIQRHNHHVNLVFVYRF